MYNYDSLQVSYKFSLQVLFFFLLIWLFSNRDLFGRNAIKRAEKNVVAKGSI